jgi:hypothetical protein
MLKMVARKTCAGSPLNICLKALRPTDPDVRLKSRSLARLISLVTCAAKKYAVPTSDPKPAAPHKIFPRAYAAKVQRPDFDRSVAATFDKPVEATPAA